MMKPQIAFLIAAMVGTTTPAMAATIYVPMGDADRILVIDGDQDRIIGKVEGVTAAHGLAGTADGKYLVAGSFAEAEPDKASVPAKPKGVSEEDHAAHHAKRSTPAEASNNAVSPVSISYASIIRVADRTVIRRVAVPGAVHHSEVTPDGRFAVLTHPNEDGVSVLDLSTFAVVKMIPTGPVPNYAVASRDGRRVYVSNAGNNTVSEIDAGSWTVRRSFTVGNSPEHMVLSRDGGALYVANVDAGSVSVVELPRGKVVKTYVLGGRPHGIGLSDDEKTLFVSGLERNELIAIDLVGGAMRRAALAPSPYHLAVIPGTGKLYVSSAEEDKIWVVDQETLAPRSEIPLGGQAHQMVVDAR